jgi:hypothetical protein
MKVFINEFRIKKIPEELATYRVNIKNINIKETFRLSAISARTLSEKNNQPIASLGNQIICSPEVKLPSFIESQVKIQGNPLNISINLEKNGIITSKDEGFSEFCSRYLNREIDIIMKHNDFLQEGRTFFSKKQVQLAFNFYLLRGAYISTKYYKNNVFTVISDSIINLRSNNTFLEDLNKVLIQKKISHWRDALQYERQINSIFWSRAPRLKTSYYEIKGYGEPEKASYKFRGFDFSKSISDSVEGKISPLEWHRMFGREANPDQPIVKVTARGPFFVHQIPEFLEEQPSFEKLKRIQKTAREAHSRALLSSLDRLLATTDILQPLISSEFIEESPLIKEAINYAPVEFDIGGDFINISKNRDFFTKYFEKKKLFKKPDINRIFFITTEKDMIYTKKFLSALKNIFSEFNLDFPKIEFYESSEKELVKTLIEYSKLNEFQRSDLVFIISDLEKTKCEKISDDPYYLIKKYSLSEKIFPTQFININTLQQAKKIDIEVVRQVFIQIIAKCKGQPWSLVTDPKMKKSLFMALDNYFDPFGETEYNGASLCIFDSKGAYILSSAIPYKKDTWFNIVEKIVNKIPKELFIKYENINILKDGRQFGIKIKDEIDFINKILIEKGVNEKNITHIRTNHTSYYRIFTSEGNDILSAGTTPPLTAVLDMLDPTAFLIASTEPIFSSTTQREMGTPRPVYYSIQYPEEAEKRKNEIAKSLAWLCRHSWCSPVFMRTPVPLEYAKKISSLVAKIGVDISPAIGDAPLYL